MGPHFGPPHPHWFLASRDTSTADENVSEPISADACELEMSSTGQCCNAEGYGEMAPASVERMAALLGVTNTTPTESFFDLGSGTGRLVMHMAVKGYARLATGVELNGGRHTFAIELAASALPQEMPLAAGNVTEATAAAEGAARGCAGAVHSDHEPIAWTCGKR